MPSGPPTRDLKPLLLIPVAVLLVVHPLLIHGPSAGQDLAFHLQSWLDAAAQLRHGHYPHWDITAAWNAGEPRFLFYPPLSWLLGAILNLIFPIAFCPTIFIAIALLLSGFTFHKLASEFTTPNAALLASTLYLANPYMLFTAFERSALAELLAAAWIPLLLLALLRPTPTDLPSSLRTIRNIAIPLALLWFTNAPAAVIGSYTLALLATLRILNAIFTPATAVSAPATAVFAPATIGYPEASASGLIRPQKKRAFSPPGMPFRLALTYLAGTTLGLTLPALYLLPAAYERRYVQTAMALLPNMRYQDNFLFTHTPDAAHNAVNQTISLLALTLLASTVALIALLLARRTPNRKNLLLNKSVILSERSESKDPGELSPTHSPSAFSTNRATAPHLPYTLALLTLLIAFLLTPLSTPIWQHLPNLAYLQFPWRLLILLTPILALCAGLLLDRSRIMGAPSVRASADGWDAKASSRTRLTTAVTLLLPLALAIPAYRLYHQLPDPTDDPTALAQLFTTHHGFPPTDEYTPTQADNDPLRSNNPAYWLANNPNDPAPNTTPTAVELNPSLDTDDTPIPDNQTLSSPTPHHFQIHAPTRSYLILNLRDYPNWQITTGCEHCLFFKTFNHIPRTDGLLAIVVPAGASSIDITWHRTPDQTLGLLLTTLALLALAFTYRRRSSSQQ
jgi:hypothetical protein